MRTFPDAAALREPRSLQDLLFYRIWRAAYTSKSMVTRMVEGGFGITCRELGIIGVLVELGKVPASTLAECLHLERASTSLALRSLSDKKLVERLQDADDRRVVRVCLTSAGRQLFDDLYPRISRFNLDLVDGIDLANLDVLSHCLHCLELRGSELKAQMATSAHRKTGCKRPPEGHFKQHREPLLVPCYCRMETSLPSSHSQERLNLSKVLSSHSLDELIPFRLSRAIRTGRSMATRLADDSFGITHREWGMIGVLAETGEVTSSVFAGHMHLDRVRTSRGLGSLVMKGLVDRRRDAEDGRAIYVRMSPLGHQLFDELFPLIARLNVNFLEGIDAAHVDIFLSCLRQLELRGTELSSQDVVSERADRRGGGTRRQWPRYFS